MRLSKHIHEGFLDLFDGSWRDVSGLGSRTRIEASLRAAAPTPASAFQVFGTRRVCELQTLHIRRAYGLRVEWRLKGYTTFLCLPKA